MNPKKLSMCVVALNEEVFLPNLLQDIREQLYKHELIEIVLVDSGSRDKTKEIMENFSGEENGFYSVQVLDNPKRNQAAGWNVAIKHATGDVISRIDAHTKIPADFSSSVMKHIHNGEMIVGGIRPCIIENDTWWAKTLLEVENSLFGSSIGGSRRSKETAYVKTMFHASYRKEVFEEVGLFNEGLLRTEDNEMHYRIRQAGYKLFYTPEIVSYQYARCNLRKMMRQKYGNGYWIGITVGVCPECLAWYHFIPAMFVLAIFVTTVLTILGMCQFAIVMWGLYGLFAIFNTLTSIGKNNRNPLMLLMPVLFLILHICYGVGTLNAILNLFVKRNGRK